MKFHIVIPFFLLCIFSSCDTRKEYHYDEGSIPIFEEKSKGTRIYGLDYYLYAKDDNTAKQIARNRFNSHFQIALSKLDALITGKEEDGFIMTIPAGYTLTTKDGRKIDGYSVWSSYSFRQIETNVKYDKAESNNVFAGLQFGMSVSEARTVELFKSFRWDAKEEALMGTCEIGLNSYSADLLFYKNSLYQIKFSTSPRNKSHSNANDMQGEIVNLRNVFWRAYGMPSIIGTIPSDANIDSIVYDILDRTRFGDIYTWNLPGKQVVLGYDRPNNNFRMVATITDELLLRSIKADRANITREKQQTERDVLEQSSELFN